MSKSSRTSSPPDFPPICASDGTSVGVGGGAIRLVGFVTLFRVSTVLIGSPSLKKSTRMNIGTRGSGRYSHALETVHVSSPEVRPTPFVVSI